MILNYEKWDTQINITSDEATTLIFRDLSELYRFQKELINQIETNEGPMAIFNGDKPLKIEKEVEVVSNLFTLSLNNRKTINFLHKSIVEDTGKTDQVIEFEKIRKSVFEWIRKIRGKLLLNFEFEETFDLSDVLKVLNVKFEDNNNTPIEILTKYLELTVNISKTKVIFLTFASYLLSSEELSYFIEYCKINDIILVLIEKEKPINNDLNKFITIIEDTILV